MQPLTRRSRCSRHPLPLGGRGEIAAELASGQEAQAADGEVGEEGAADGDDADAS